MSCCRPRPRARLRYTCLGCGSTRTFATSHGGVLLRFCGACLEVAERAAIDLTDNSPAAVVRTVAEHAATCPCMP